MRHVKASALLSDDLLTAVVTFEEVTHRSYAFGNGQDFVVYVAGRRIRLYSTDLRTSAWRNNQLAQDMGTELLFIIPGRQYSLPFTYTMSATDWPKLKEALKAYNRCYKK